MRDASGCDAMDFDGVGHLFVLRVGIACLDVGPDDHRRELVSFR
jgi:hypothetical protein